MTVQKKKTKRSWTKSAKHTNLRGVFKKKEGGYLVRARVTDPRTGQKREIKKVFLETDEMTAYRWLEEEKVRIKTGRALVPQQKTPFGGYAVSLLERKLLKGQIKSARGRERWRYTLEHLIKGTKGVPGFGDMNLEDIGPRDTEAWIVGIAKLIKAGSYAPATVNGWIGIVKVIGKAAMTELELPSNPFRALECFDLSERPTYTEEEPNALSPEETQTFLACMQEEFPQHYAMTCLGFATGLRPSSLRPLRRKGATPDVLWEEGKILVRRSHSLGNEIMNTTKTGLRQRITVPTDLIDVLRWHCSTQLGTPEQQASELLFPREDGGVRTESCLSKAFAIVGGLIGLKKTFSPRGMRRTFNDMCRAVQVEHLVTKSISGHLTDRMKDHYSTVSPIEQRESIGRVLQLVRMNTPRATPKSGAPSGAPQDESGAPEEPQKRNAS